MFEALVVDQPAARFRRASLPPLIALLISQAYLLTYPFLGRVPPLLFHSIVVVLLVGTIAGAWALIRMLRRGRPRGSALAWALFAAGVELICARLFLALALPWI